MTLLRFHSSATSLLSDRARPAERRLGWLRTFAEVANILAAAHREALAALTLPLRERIREYITRYHVELIEEGTRLCRRCVTVHRGWHRCPNRLWTFCEDCGRKRLLDEKGQRCPQGHMPHGQRHLRTGGDRIR